MRGSASASGPTTRWYARGSPSGCAGHLEAATIATVTPDEAREEAQREVDRLPLRLRLSVAFVSKDRPNAAGDADALARSLAAAPETPAPYGGDRAPIASAPWWSEEDLARATGASVARAALGTPIGSWSSPVASSWGFYLVRPLERRAPTAAEAMSAAMAEIRRRKGADAVSRAVSRVTTDYDVSVRSPAGEPAFDPRAVVRSLGPQGRCRLRHLVALGLALLFVVLAGDARAHASRTAYPRRDRARRRRGRRLALVRAGCAPRAHLAGLHRRGDRERCALAVRHVGPPSLSARPRRSDARGLGNGRRRRRRDRAGASSPGRRAGRGAHGALSEPRHLRRHGRAARSSCATWRSGSSMCSRGSIISSSSSRSCGRRTGPRRDRSAHGPSSSDAPRPCSRSRTRRRSRRRRSA